MLLLASLAVVAFITIPLGYVFLNAASAGVDTWSRLIQTRLLGLLANTISLTAAVTLGTIGLGVSLAFLTERTSLPFGRVWRWLLAMPLAIPPYIGAVVHVAILRPRGGYLPQFLENMFGWSGNTPTPFGFWGASFILTIFMFPYVYLLSAAAFRSIHASYEEISRASGRGLVRTLWDVILPILKPGIGAGALLVAMDVLSEYGTVALLRYDTFSAAIFQQLAGRYDRSAAAILSGILVLLAISLFWGEIKFQGQARYYQIAANWRPSPLIPLKKWNIPALAFVIGVVAMSLLIPITILAIWTIQSFIQPAYLGGAFQVGSQGLINFIWNSIWSAGLAGFIAVLLSLPVGYLAIRYPRLITTLFSRISQVGYALPGVVVALSLLLMVNRFLPILYATPLIVVMAYVLRHIPQAVRSSQASLAQVAPTMEEAAQSLGRTSLKAFFQVTIPLIMPGLLAGGTLVFLSSLKELPATLLLRPAGFDTLAVRVWIWAEEGMFTQAAPAALVLILAAAVPLYFLLRQERA
ncbi:MAG: iron ABC transporter permease [Anaerolineales bacterium]|nr:iron ABC transporter permease [Anaerolineales bacterium]